MVKPALAAVKLVVDGNALAHSKGKLLPCNLFSPLVHETRKASKLRSTFIGSK